MGTHPIFESDFDCLTGMASLYYSGRIVVPSTSKTSLHDRFTSLMKNRPSSLGQPSNPSRQGSEKNKRLAAQMESRESVQTALTAERRRGLDQRLGWNNNRRKQPYFKPYGRGGLKAGDAERRRVGSRTRILRQKTQRDERTEQERRYQPGNSRNGTTGKRTGNDRPAHHNRTNGRSVTHSKTNLVKY